MQQAEELEAGQREESEAQSETPGETCSSRRSRIMVPGTEWNRVSTAARGRKSAFLREEKPGRVLSRKI